MARKRKNTEISAKETKVNKNTLMKPDSSAFKRPPSKPVKITKEKLKEYLPRGSRHTISEALLEMIGRMEDDTGLPQDLMEEEVLSYMHILKKVPRTTIEELINAVKFCNLKRNYSNEKAWSIVFPDKYDRLKKLGKQIDNHVAMYNKSALVQEIDKEMLIPFYIQYAPYAHAAVKKQFDLMNGRAAPNAKGENMTVSPMVQHLAAKTLFEMTSMPETAKIDLTISKSEEEISLQQEMNQQLAQLVKQQKARLEMGESIEDVQQIGINLNDAVEAEIEDVSESM